MTTRTEGASNNRPLVPEGARIVINKFCMEVRYLSFPLSIPAIARPYFAAPQAPSAETAR